MEGKLPLSVTVPPPRAPPTEPHPALRNPTFQDPEKRDSALTSNASTTAATISLKKGIINNFTHDKGVDNESSSIRSPSSTFTSATALAHITTNENDVPATPISPGRSLKFPQSPKKESASPKNLLRLGTGKQKPLTTSLSPTVEAFSPIDTKIPTDDLIDMDFIQQMQFSKRGSMLWGGKKVASPSPSPMRQNLEVKPPKVLSFEIETESQKVRSLYDSSEAQSMNWRDGRMSPFGEDEKVTVAEGIVGE